MRYQNWDVLLFPGTARVPMQEFETRFHVLTVASGKSSVLLSSSSSTSSTSLSTSTSTSASTSTPPRLPVIDNNLFVSAGSSDASRYESPTKLPLLTCFISTQLDRSPFRVSVHSWAPPSPSCILLAHKAKHETVAFQARVHIDGVHQCSRIFSQAVSWPEVFDRCDSTAARPSTDLQFPSFHPELLQQASWDAADHRGRIRITISEGVMQGTAFERKRDVVAFSFQHAPLNVLEHSGLAWPNPRAFASETKLPPHVFSRVLDHEAHAHAHAHTAPKSMATLDDPFVDTQSVLTLLPAQWRLRSRATTTTTTTATATATTAATATVADESLPETVTYRREQTGRELSVETSSVVEGAARARSGSLAKRKRSGSEAKGIGASDLHAVKVDGWHGT